MMAFDEDKYKKIFESRYGAGSFDSGLKQASDIGRLKVQADVAKQQYNKRVKEAQAAAKKAEQASKYNNIFGGTTPNVNAGKQLDDMIKNPKKNGAYRNAESVRNDPSLQAELKQRGYTSKQFIDAMYNASSGGKFRSEREYNQFAGQLNKDTKISNKAADKASIDKTGLNVQDYWDQVQKPAIDAQKNKKNTTSDNKGFLGGLFDKLKKSEVGRATTAAEQFFNPFDNVKAKDAVDNYLNHKQSHTFQEVSRGANRAVDSASLGLMSNLDKKVNNREPYYNSQRDFGKGGGTDFLTSGLGYLVPGVGATKAVKALGVRCERSDRTSQTSSISQRRGYRWRSAIGRSNRD
jgi:hypothetical protein